MLVKDFLDLINSDIIKTTFEDVNIGDKFLSMNVFDTFGDIYVKIDTVYDDFNGEYNCFNLSKCQLEFKSAYTECIIK